ncbi:phosphoribosyltransferase [Tenacibaculum sp. 190130A14a]|uniref:Pyrimidine operon attenuation protein / uracil phosphoribosyltransferase n=1 Tax=Tenacibaculum polynesiense TaxID=3137857 RepID=A0ABP1EX60_9FLAO
MITEENIILNNLQIEQKIKRIAYQIYESNSDEHEIVLAGIKEKGIQLAVKIGKVLETISEIKVILCEVTIDKKNPIGSVATSIPATAYENKALVLIDDVLHSGTTLIYGVKHFLEVPLKRFKTAVLVNRNHKKYPIKADFKGISLSTSIKEHVVVKFEENKTTAYLT